MARTVAAYIHLAAHGVDEIFHLVAKHPIPYDDLSGGSLLR